MKKEKKTFTNKKGILLMVFPEQRNWGQGGEQSEKPGMLILWNGVLSGEIRIR